jgi:C4-dicarboxylate-specific signal transduction histidine kinase
VVIATDVTERYEAEEEAQKQAEKAQAASRLITMGEMASSVAHELNQPLAAISNYCSGMISRLQRQQLEPDVLLSALEKTAKQAQRAGQIISRIRTFVKRSEPSVSSTKVSEIVSDALELAQIELRRQDVRLNYYMAARIPNVMADPILIEQVLINLIKNGAESVSHAKRPYNQREVELSVRPTEVDGQKVVEFQVRDTGTGIPDDIKERIYDAFYSTKSEGMGIGLKLCRSIVESHHGRMNVENIYNGPTIIGCCFSFWIPVSLTPEPRETPAEPISPVDQE